MLDFFAKQKLPIILTIIGFFLTIISYFDVTDIAKLQISRTNNPIYPTYILGVVLILIAISLYIIEEDLLTILFSRNTLGWTKLGKVIKLEKGFGAKFRESEVNIIFGRIESLENSDFERTLIVLPANEFFDEDCIKDKRSSLGAFIQEKYPNQTEKIQLLIKEKLETLPNETVEKETGIFEKSYGIGSSVFLDQPLSSKQKILFLPITTKRVREGLRTEMYYVFKCINEIQRVVTDKRLDSVYIPLIGSGHGGLKKDVALFSMLLAVCDMINQPSGHNIRSFNVIVFQANPKEEPGVSPKNVKHLLKTTIGMFY